VPRIVFKSLKDQVSDYVRHEIDEGRLKDGDRVVEASISDNLGVSRTPVREALIQLAGDGYLCYESRRGFRVRGCDEKSAREIFEMLGPLDGRAAYLALPQMNDATINHLVELCNNMDEAIGRRDAKAYDDLQHEFHFSYIDRCGNERLAASIDELERFFSKRSYEKAADEVFANFTKANKEHRRIIQLFRERDAYALQDYVRDVHWSIDTAHYATW
jgi:DNA-binding GntR family transcriptional regulator